MTRLITITLVLLGRLASAAEPKIIYEQDPTLLTTSVELVVLTGSEDDPSGKAGLANLMSQFMLRGTKKKKRSVFQSEIERLGASVSVHTNHDTIVFSGQVIKENTGAFLKIVEDFLLHPAFAKKEFDLLRTEILAEIANRKNQNMRLAGLALRKELYSGTVLEWPTEGGESTVRKIALDDVQWAYNNRVHQGNVIFGIASALAEAEIRKLLTEMWLKLPDGARKTRKSIPAALSKKTSIVLVNKPDTSTGTVVFGQPGITAQEPLRYTLITGNFAFGGEPLVARLFRVIRSELGWTYSIGSSYEATGNLSYQQGLFIVSSTPSVEFTTKSILKILSMWREYFSGGLKPEELRLARESQVNSYPFEFESALKRLSQKLQAYLYNVPVPSPDEYAKVINGVNNKALKRALKQKQEPERFVITLVADKRVIEKQLLEEQKDVSAEKRLSISKVLSPDEVVQ